MNPNIRKKISKTVNTSSGDKNCEFWHFYKLDVSYAIKHTFSKVRINDILERKRNKGDVSVPMVPKKDVIILLPFLGLQSNQISKRPKFCIYQFFSCVNRPFPSSSGPLFQNEGRCSAFDMEIIFYSHANKTHFRKKGCAPSFILKVRVFGTQKWPIFKDNFSKRLPY